MEEKYYMKAPRIKKTNRPMHAPKGKNTRMRGTLSNRESHGSTTRALFTEENTDGEI
jgi:hypothetical protein